MFCKRIYEELLDLAIIDHNTVWAFGYGVCCVEVRQQQEEIWCDIYFDQNYWSIKPGSGLLEHHVFVEPTKHRGIGVINGDIIRPVLRDINRAFDEAKESLIRKPEEGGLVFYPQKVFENGVRLRDF